MGIKEYVARSGPLISMIMVQVFVAGLQILSKIILNQGIFIFALMTYRHIVAAIFIAPFALFMERDMVKKITWLVLGWVFINSLFGISLAMGLFYYGLRETNATYATNFLNLIPIVTFAFSVVARLEKLGLGSKAGRMKIGGTILCVAGALTYGLYHGEAFHIIPPPHHGLFSSHHMSISKNTKLHWLGGTIMLISSCFSYAVWFLIQVKLFQVYPSKYWSTVLTCIMGSLQSMVIGLSVDRSCAPWKLGWNLQLIVIIYSGILATGATFCLILWAIKKRGPTYPPMFNPLSLIFVAISEAIWFGEAIYVGGILGMAMIIVGLYAFLWGKRNESPSPPSASRANIVELPASAPAAAVLPVTTMVGERIENGIDRKDTP